MKMFAVVLFAAAAAAGPQMPPIPAIDAAARRAGPAMPPLPTIAATRNGQPTCDQVFVSMHL